MRHFLSAIAIVAFHCAIPAARAQQPAAEGCIVLSTGHQAARFGSQYLFVRDGDAYYRIEFPGDSCAALRSASVTISTGGQPLTLCRQGTRVSSRAGSCAVDRYVPTDAKDYERHARRSRN